MKILLAEDDRKLGPLLVHMLKKEGHSTDWVLNGEEALDYASQISYDVVVLDWMMPIKEGIAVCRELRGKGFTGGILMLTAKDALHSRVEGLDSGADDYLIKPFEFAELMARIRSLLRRSQQPLGKERMSIGNFTLNITEHTLQDDKQIVALTIREFQLLELLLRNAGRIVPRELIFDRIWGYEIDVTSNSLDALVKQLRRKLELFEHPPVISNVRGVGYRLDETS